MKSNILKAGLLAIALSSCVNAVDYAAFGNAAKAKLPTAIELAKEYSMKFKSGMSLTAIMEDAMMNIPGKMLGVDLKDIIAQGESVVAAKMGLIEGNMQNAIDGIQFALDSNQMPVIASTAGLVVGFLKDLGVLPGQLDIFATKAQTLVTTEAVAVNSIGAAMHGLLSQIKDAMVSIKSGLASKDNNAAKAAFLKNDAAPYLFNTVIYAYFTSNIKPLLIQHANKVQPLIDSAKGINWGSVDIELIKTNIKNKLSQYGISF